MLSVGSSGRSSLDDTNDDVDRARAAFVQQSTPIRRRGVVNDRTILLVAAKDISGETISCL